MEDTELMEAEREDVSQGMGMIVNQVANYKSGFYLNRDRGRTFCPIFIL